MEQFIRVKGIAAPLLLADIDTDQIIPGHEILRSTEESHARWGSGLFANWRYVGDRQPNPEFVLNQPPYDRAQVLLADRNFGCGSSRENAPKALRGFGFRALVAPSYGDIFFSNCFRNGLLPVKLPFETVRSLADEAARNPSEALIEIDLEKNILVAPDGKPYAFETPDVLRRMLLVGKDEVELSWMHKAEIDRFRQGDRSKRPWAYRLEGHG